MDGLLESSVIVQLLLANPTAVAVAVVVVLLATLWVVFSYRNKAEETGTNAVDSEESSERSRPQPYTLRVFYSTQTGTAKLFAEQLVYEAREAGIKVILVDIKGCDPEETLTQECTGRSVCVFLISTYTDGGPPDSASWFFQWLSDTVADFRVQKSIFSGMKYAVFGLGNSEYAEHFNTAGRNLFDWLGKLSGTAVYRLGLGDQNVAQSAYGGIAEDFQVWKDGFTKQVFPVLKGESEDWEAGSKNCGASCACVKEEEGEGGECQRKKEREPDKQQNRIIVRLQRSVHEMATQESPEECAFRQHSAALLHAIDSPDELAWQLYSRDIISSLVKSKALVRELSKEEKNSILLSAVEGRIRAEPTVFDAFKELLLDSNDPLLRVFGERLKSSHLQASQDTPSTHELQVQQRKYMCSHSESVRVLPQPEDLIALYAVYLRSVYAHSANPVCDKWPHLQSQCYINLATISKRYTTKTELDDFTKATLHGDIDQIFKKKTPIKIEDILATDSGHKLRCVLVEGGPGVGKTTFSWEVCKRWGKGELFQEYSIVVLLSLREAWVQRATEVSDLFYYSSKATQKQIAAEIVKMEGKDMLVILDGLDELPARFLSKHSVIRGLLTGVDLPLATVLVTSRPSVTDRFLLQTEIRHIEILGFTKQDIHGYTERNLPVDLVPSFTEYLAMYPQIRTMMYIPLNSAIVTEVYKHNRQSGRPTPTTVTQLYTDLSLTLLLRYLLSHPDYKDHDLELNTISDLPKFIFVQFQRLCQVAYNGVLERCFNFPKLGQSFDHLGFMHSTPTCPGPIRSSVAYSFLHLSIQEYLAATHISYMSPEEQTKLFADKYHLQHLYSLWRFVFGLTKLSGLDLSVVQKCLFGHRSATPILDSNAVELLFEAQDPQLLSILGDTSVTFGAWGLHSSTSIALAYCVAHSKCMWTFRFHSLGEEVIGEDTAEILGRGLEEYGTSHAGFVHTVQGSISAQWLQALPTHVLHGIQVLDITLPLEKWSNLARPTECMPSLHTIKLHNMHMARQLQSSFQNSLFLCPTRVHHDYYASQVLEPSKPPDPQLLDLCASMSRLSYLKVLRLDGYNCSLADADALRQLLLSTSSLVELDLSESSVPPEAISSISEGLSTNRTLKSLLFQQKKFLSAGMQAFSRMLGVNGSLIRVDISSCDIDDDNACVLAEGLCHNNSLMDLDISYNPFGDRGAVAIARVLRTNTSLKQLALIGWKWRTFSLDSSITNTGVKELVESLFHNRTLAKLVLLKSHKQYLTTLPAYHQVKGRIELTSWHRI